MTGKKPTNNKNLEASDKEAASSAALSPRASTRHVQSIEASIGGIHRLLERMSIQMEEIAESVALGQQLREQDNGRQFANALMDKLCEKFNFKQYKSSMYNVAANGLDYRTTHRTPMGVMPYSLTYGVEAILPLEREIPSLRMTVQKGLTTEDNAKLCLQELEADDENRLTAQRALECYQARMSKVFYKHVKPRSFQVDDLVLAVRRPIITARPTGNKFTPK
ncbi:uncharacterized protein LOC120076180 [Benincasa hispida]|uniref:uncharacterized protein LOC120076180 n=1 Tax=Benincasa hispida TaxID=102211 RepID=UPI0018FFEB09|nr:uncharacterized protein LOC120076180 [Benincasa hispida]